MSFFKDLQSIISGVSKAKFGFHVSKLSSDTDGVHILINNLYHMIPILRQYTEVNEMRFDLPVKQLELLDFQQRVKHIFALDFTSYGFSIYTFVVTTLINQVYWAFRAEFEGTKIEFERVVCGTSNFHSPWLDLLQSIDNWSVQALQVLRSSYLKFGGFGRLLSDWSIPSNFFTVYTEGVDQCDTCRAIDREINLQTIGTRSRSSKVFTFITPINHFQLSHDQSIIIEIESVGITTTGSTGYN